MGGKRQRLESDRLLPLLEAKVRFRLMTASKLAQGKAVASYRSPESARG